MPSAAVDILYQITCIHVSGAYAMLVTKRERERHPLILAVMRDILRAFPVVNKQPNQRGVCSIEYICLGQLA